MAMLVSSINLREGNIDKFRLQGSPKRTNTKAKDAKAKTAAFATLPPTIPDNVSPPISTVEKTQTTTSVDRHSYVPTLPAAESQLPTMTNLINSSVRFHLKPANTIEEERHRQQMATAIDDSAEHCVFEDNDIDVEDMEEGMGGGITTGRSAKPLLDLGTVHLQRIISQLQGLKHSMAHTDFKFDPNSSRRAGLNDYCEYLKGHGIIKIASNTKKS